MLHIKHWLERHWKIVLHYGTPKPDFSNGYKCGSTDFTPSNLANLKTIAGTNLDDIAAALDDLSGAEVGFIDGVTAGTLSASKAVVLDADKKADGAKPGGLIGATVASSTPIGADGSDGAFDQAVTIPADVLAAGDTFRIRGAVAVFDSDGASPGTLDLTVRVGGVAVATVPQLTPSTDVGGGGPSTEIVYFDLIGVVIDDTNATVYGAVFYDVGGTAVNVAVSDAPSTLDFTSDQDVDVNCVWGGTDADDKALLAAGMAVFRN